MKKVSVIMGVFNGEKYLRNAIESILDQSFLDFDFIICNDGSTDNTKSIITEYAISDDRVILLNNTTNKGLGYSLNKCIEASNSEYLVRMDGDDYSISSRLEVLVDTIENNSEYSVIGTAMTLFDSEEEWGQTTPITYPTSYQVYKGPAVAHATVIMRRSAIISVGMYNVACDEYRIEDYDLWCRLNEKGFSIMSINKKLYKCRWDRNDYYSRRKYKHLLGLVKYKLHWSKKMNLGIKGKFHALVVFAKAITPTFIKKLHHRRKLSK